MHLAGKRSPVWLPIFAAVGCDPREGEDSGPHCRDDAQVISAETVTPLGFAPRAILDLLVKPYDGSLSWSGGGTTTLAIGYEPDGGLWYVDSEVAPGDGDTQPAIEPICDDRVEVGATVTFTTSDGAFAETWPAVRLSATTADAANWNVELDLAALDGSFDLVPFVEAKDYDELRAWAGGSVVGVGSSAGRVSGQASGDVDCAGGEPCASWAEQVDVATWGKADPE